MFRKKKNSLKIWIKTLNISGELFWLFFSSTYIRFQSGIPIISDEWYTIDMNV